MAQDEVPARPWWKPDLLAGAFLALAAVHLLVIGWAAGHPRARAGLHDDAIIDGLGRLILEVEAGIVGATVLLFLLIPVQGVRIGLLVLLATFSLLALSLATGR